MQNSAAYYGNLEARLDAHDRELEQIQKTQREDRDDVRSLRNMIMGALAAALGGLVLQLINMLAAGGAKAH